MTSKRMWFIRSGRDATFFDSFRSEGYVGVGWNKIGKLSPDVSDEELEHLFAKAYPEDKEGTRKVWAAQVRRFMREVEVGDGVATYDPNERLYLLGWVESGIEHRDGPMPLVRRVKWSHRVLRDQLSAATRNGLGSIATFFKPSADATAELWSKAVALDSPEAAAPLSQAPAEEHDEGTEAVLREEQIEKAEQFIEDRIAKLNWTEMQQLVAGILRAMGYRTRVSEPGPDRGVDVFASPDGLGLQEPRIFCEVKHRVGDSMGAQEIRAFLGGRQRGDRCLYVSTGGFTKDARYEADRASVPIRLIALPDLRELLVEHYESLDAEARALVPLKKLYWPVG
jgi:restriction system protein